jgi:glutamate N-acetyltransferase/amino-acid N-acetyltransferase
MATMLAVLTTDAEVVPEVLGIALANSVSDTFDALSVDGCRSTNDTVAVLASGRAGGVAVVRPDGPAFHALVDAMTAVCGALAEQMAADAEGATKLVRVTVTGARSSEDARVAARAVANSRLVACSLNGEDPYWGRVLSELGASGAFFDPERVDIAYNGTVVCRDGVAATHDATVVAKALAGREIVLHCDLRGGHGRATVLTTDLSHAYIDENRRTS